MDKMDLIAIKDIRSGMKNINVTFIVLEITAATKTKENREVFSFKIADQSASINCSIWDEPGKLLQAGDIVRMTKCYASPFRGSLTLYSGKNGDISRIGDFMMVFNETINMSEMPINPPAPQTLPVNNTTNGNGRPAINSAAPAASSNTSDKPKVNSNRNYIRKPINKK